MFYTYANTYICIYKNKLYIHQMRFWRQKMRILVNQEDLHHPIKIPNLRVSTFSQNIDIFRENQKKLQELLPQAGNRN